MGIHIDLVPELEKYVAEKVSSGQYASADEFIHDCLFREKERERHKLRELRQLIADGIAEADRCEAEPFDAMEILAEVRSEAKAAESGAV